MPKQVKENATKWYFRPLAPLARTSGKPAFQLYTTLHLKPSKIHAQQREYTNLHKSQEM